MSSKYQPNNHRHIKALHKTKIGRIENAKKRLRLCDLASPQETFLITEGPSHLVQLESQAGRYFMSFLNINNGSKKTKHSVENKTSCAGEILQANSEEQNASSQWNMFLSIATAIGSHRTTSEHPRDILMDLQQTTSSLLFSFLGFLVIVILAKNVRKGRTRNLPPGSLGLPVIGQTLEFLRARESNKCKEWVEEKVAKYGPTFKTSLIGCPTVVITGQAGNKFILQNDYNIITAKKPFTTRRIVGEKSLFELSVEDHKRMRGAIMKFMKPEALQKFVGRMESVIVQHFANCWEGNESITVWPLMKKVTFHVACNILFSLKDSEEMERLGEDFSTAVKGLHSLPLDFPGTTFNRALKARSRINKRLSSLLEVRRKEIERGESSTYEDLMSCMLSMKDENNKTLTEEEIIDNMVMVMIAGHDTTSVLLTHLIRMLSLHPEIYQNILQEHNKVLAEKSPNEPLAWEDIQKIKYTWKVALETLRMIPPGFGMFRKTIKDIEYDGYTIPKGWQLYCPTSTHWSDKVFKEPLNFDPTHFDTVIPPYNFMGFGGGSRICPGYDFSKMETIIFLHHLVLKYKWSMMVEDEKISANPFPVPVLGLPVNLKENKFD